jgi:hypothetical protein
MSKELIYIFEPVSFSHRVLTHPKMNITLWSCIVDHGVLVSQSEVVKSSTVCHCMFYALQKAVLLTWTKDYGYVCGVLSVFTRP